MVQYILPINYGDHEKCQNPALDYFFHNQNQIFSYLRLLANNKADMGNRLDIPCSYKFAFGDYYGVP